MSEDGKQFDRRSVLKTVGSAAVAGIGLGVSSGSVAAIEAKNRLERAYEDERRLRIAFEQHGTALRGALVEAGLVGDDFSFAGLDFDIDTERTRLEPEADDRLAGITAIGDETSLSALGMVSTSSDTHDIALFVQPERDRAYALAEPKDGGDRVLVSDEGVDAITQSYTRCTSCCDENYRTEEEVDCTIEEDRCVVLGTSCGCFDCDCGSISTC